jgi:hypothetical protein
VLSSEDGQAKILSAALNPKPADQEYDRRITELWFFFRLLLLNEQIKGLTPRQPRSFAGALVVTARPGHFH